MRRGGAHAKGALWMYLARWTGYTERLEMTRRHLSAISSLVCVTALAALGVWRWHATKVIALTNPAWALNGADESHERAGSFSSLIPSHGREIMAKADKVEIFKLEGIILNPIVDDGQKIIRTEIPDATLSRELSDALGNPGMYKFPSSAKRCGGFQPREAVRYPHGRESVTFL